MITALISWQSAATAFDIMNASNSLIFPMLSLPAYLCAYSRWFETVEAMSARPARYKNELYVGCEVSLLLLVSKRCCTAGRCSPALGGVWILVLKWPNMLHARIKLSRSGYQNSEDFGRTKQRVSLDIIWWIMWHTLIATSAWNAPKKSGSSQYSWRLMVRATTAYTMAAVMVAVWPKPKTIGTTFSKYFLPLT